MTIPETSSSGSGHCGSIARAVSARISATARSRYHFLSAGMTNQGAASVEQRASASV